MTSEIFDFGEELQFLDQAPDRYSMEGEDFFYLCRCCGMIGIIISVFESERTEKGCVITAYGKICLHSIEVREGSILLGSALIEDKAPGNRDSFFAGYSKLGRRHSARFPNRAIDPANDRLLRPSESRVGGISSQSERSVGLLRV